MKFRFATPLLCRIGTCAFLLLLCVFVSAGTRAASDPPIPSGSIRIHYHRPDGNYSGWTVYAFDNTTENTGNYGGGPVQVTGTDSFGAYFDVGGPRARKKLASLFTIQRRPAETRRTLPTICLSIRPRKALSSGRTPG